jgi:hypothetical protein
MKLMKQNKDNSRPENEWVIQLVDAAENSVKVYERYLLDKLGYQELAKIMQELRDLLPDGCKDDKD